MIVRLKWNKTEYKGTLISIDNYMNLQLDKTSEVIYEDGEKKEEVIGEIEDKEVQNGSDSGEADVKMEDGN